jgi:uncharacterized OsmC-like protein
MTVRTYATRAESSGTFGRVLIHARDQHLIVDGPVHNGCPGEAITPAELFLSGVVACGVELIEVLARELEIPLRGVSASIAATQDSDQPVYDYATVFNTVAVDLQLRGVTTAQAEDLAARFQRRCPLFGTVNVATPKVTVTVSVVADA